MSDLILTLQEDFQPIVKSILESMTAKGWQPYVAQGLRTQAQERALVAAGNSQTMHSYHLTGLAADIVDRRWGWNISNVHQFWWDLYESAKEQEVPNGGHLRYGIIWDHPERAEIYKHALDTKQPHLVNWFCDVAHVEMHRG